MVPPGRLNTISQGTGSDERTYSFDYYDKGAGNSAGYVKSVTDPMGISSFTYDDAGRLKTSTLHGGRVIVFDYDGNGNLTSLTPPGRPAHTLTYSPVNQITEYKAPAVPDGGTNKTGYRYTDDRELRDVCRPDNQVLNFDYDTAGRLAASCILAPNQPCDLAPKQEALCGLAGNQKLASYTYDPLTGKLHTITTRDSDTLTYNYEGSFLAKTTWAGTIAGSVGRTYDSDFRVDSLNVNDADSITFKYYTDSALEWAGDLHLDRDPQNGLLTGSTLGKVTDAYTYNDFGEVKTYEAKFANITLFTENFDFADAYDKSGRIHRKTETIDGVTTTFVYEYLPSGDLGTVTITKDGVTTVNAYTYDGNGNRLTGPGLSITPGQKFDEQDRLPTQYGNNSYHYTENGELKTKAVGTSSPKFYEYDVLGNLRSVTLPDGITKFDYFIDGQNRRVGKKKNGIVKGFLYQDGLRVIAELDGNNNVVRRFVYGTRDNVPDYMIKDGVKYRIITDHLGSPRLVVKADDGSVAQRIDYDEFGNVIEGVPNANPGFQPFGFAGGLYDEDTTLVRFGTRDYDPEVGRWTAKDRILFAGGDTNLYSYVGNDPVNLGDPRGSKVSLCMSPFADPKWWQGPFFWAIAHRLPLHYWIRTDKVEFGLSNPPGTPNTFGTPVVRWPHTGKRGYCIPQPRVDEQCVNRAFSPMKSLGTWGASNNCQTYAELILDACTPTAPPWVFFLPIGYSR